MRRPRLFLLLLVAAVSGTAGCTGPGGAMAPSWNAFWHNPDYAVIKQSGGPSYGPPRNGGGARSNGNARAGMPYGVSPAAGAVLFGGI